MSNIYGCFLFCFLFWGFFVAFLCGFFFFFGGGGGVGMAHSFRENLYFSLILRHLLYVLSYRQDSTYYGFDLPVMGHWVG